MKNKKITMDLNFEKRRSPRKSSNSHNTALICNGTCYKGVVENMCDTGLHVIAASRECVTSFVPETMVELKINSSPEKQVNLQGEVRWVHINKTPIHGLTYRMGVEIMKESPEYDKYMKMLK